MDIEKLQKIIEIYGQKNQEQIAIEEMVELTQAICKNWRYHNDKTANNLREELADVKVMVAQLEMMYGNVDDIIEYKIGRQIKRLNQEAEKMTNFEKIKNMTVEEMVEFINCEGACNYCIYADDDDCKGLKCREGVREWLKQEAENDG